MVVITKLAVGGVTLVAVMTGLAELLGGPRVGHDRKTEKHGAVLRGHHIWSEAGY